MAKAKTATRRPRKNKRYWEHQYSVIKVDMNLRQVEVAVVIGSRDATAMQEKFEDQYFFAVVYNNTLKDEEYRTPGAEDFKMPVPEEITA